MTKISTGFFLSWHLWCLSMEVCCFLDIYDKPKWEPAISLTFLIKLNAWEPAISLTFASTSETDCEQYKCWHLSKTKGNLPHLTFEIKAKVDISGPSVWNRSKEASSFVTEFKKELFPHVLAFYPSPDVPAVCCTFILAVTSVTIARHSWRGTKGNLPLLWHWAHQTAHIVWDYLSLSELQSRSRAAGRSLSSSWRSRVQSCSNICPC